MEDQGRKIVIGALLHDIGKVIYREGSDIRRHSKSGYDYLKNDAGINDTEILDCVLYHHAKEIQNANLKEDSIAYIIYMADNIASATDRRKNESEDVGFDVHTPLQPVFNILNGNHADMWYSPYIFNIEQEINYPSSEKRSYDKSHYIKIFNNIKDNLLGIEWTDDYINSLIEVLEANLSYIPASTAANEMTDISLYDHVKLTAAVATCIYEYLKQMNTTDYKTVLYSKAAEFYSEKAFVLASVDISGIQKFIYNISSKNALKMLRSRSFYLEIMMEHIIDSILENEGLSRANLIYSGGGHCYILMPNTKRAVEIFDDYISETNEWFIKNFHTDLYIAGGYAVCSSDNLKNIPSGSYKEIFSKISEKISSKKARRYSADQIKNLNHIKMDDYTLECRACKNIGRINDNGLCHICQSLTDFSAKVLYEDFFYISDDREAAGIPLPGDYVLSSTNENELKEKMEKDKHFVRSYGKNKMCTGKRISTKLWVGNYTNGDSFEEMAMKSKGIERIGVLRADVDNLGQSFIAGFNNSENDDRYVTLSRTATLSRQLSMFFKLYINDLVGRPSFNLVEKQDTRNITIIYSGGDDLFMVGTWNDIFEVSIDIRRAFEKYTEGTLSISAGVGIYHPTYPISVIADEVAMMEEASKHLPRKNAVTLLEDGCYHNMVEDNKEYRVSDGTYRWEVLEENVIKEKYRSIADYFDNNPQIGNSLLYRILDLIRNQDDRINFARYVYLLSRLEPDKQDEKDLKERYKVFSEKMYRWIQNEEDRRQLKTAITLYVYYNRDKEEK